MQRYSEPVMVPTDPEANVATLLAERAARTPDQVLFAVQDGDGWRDISARDFERRVLALAKAFIAAGVGPGEPIGMLCSTRFEWTLVDFAAWYAGTFVVPVYETSAPEQIRWILADSGATSLVVETSEHAARFEAVRSELPAVTRVWRIDDLDALAETGTAIDDDAVAERRRRARASDTATIIYTAGTTGRPKGCELTHGNFVDLARNAAAAMPEMVNERSSTLLFVTIAHVFARFISVICIEGGVKVGHQADTSRLMAAMASFRPTFLLAVPRVFEKVYHSAEMRAEESGRGRVFRWAADVGVAHSEAIDAGRVPLVLALRFRVADALVFSRLRAALGGRVEWAISGSAPLGRRLGHFYRSIGVTILEGYGLTETTAPATVNRPSRPKIGSVGPALPGVDIRIAEDGEVEVRGIDVFAGYHGAPEATAAVFDGDWFKTGDLGSLDDEGYLTITGRKKEIIVTAGGKNVAPAELEDPIRANPIVSQVVVVGEQRPFVGALVTLDADMLPAWLANHGAQGTLSPAEAARLPIVRSEVQRAVDAANARVSRAESIREFRILDHDFTEADGHLTPKLSIRRSAILTDYAADIDALYADAAARHSTMTASTATG